jgi:hypothetical protein
MRVKFMAQLEYGKLPIMETFEGTRPEIDAWVAAKVDEFLEYFPIEEGFYKYMFSFGHGFLITRSKRDRQLIKVVYLK